MKKMIILLLMLPCTILTLQSCSDDDDDDMMQSQQFVTEAGSANRFEIETATLAKERSDNAQIETFANHMLEDHGTATVELKMVAEANGLSLATPPAMTQKHQEKYNKLAAITDVNAFEKEYANMMEDSHEETIDLFEYAAGHADMEAIRQFAAGKIDVLRHHLEEAEALDDMFNP